MITEKPSAHHLWGAAALWALPVVVVVLGLFAYWFAFANRYVVFLYGHSAEGIPRAEPFDEMTRSRYWMAGLVASAIVMLLVACGHWALGRACARRGATCRWPTWWRIWAICAPPVGAGVLAITMTASWPTLPLALALACAGATLAGLAVALMPAAWAADRPGELLWLVGDGAGLMPTLLLLRALELPARGLVPLSTAIIVAAMSVVIGWAWLEWMSALRRSRRQPCPRAHEVLLAGLGLSYLLMPLVHYLFGTPSAYHYISAASNFFAFSGWLQLLVLLVAAGLAANVTRRRRRSAHPRAEHG